MEKQKPPTYLPVFRTPKCEFENMTGAVTGREDGSYECLRHPSAAFVVREHVVTMFIFPEASRSQLESLYDRCTIDGNEYYLDQAAG